MLLDIDNLSVTLGSDKILEDVSLMIESGEFIGLVGPNGAGKTTLLRVILGLLKPTSGQVVKSQPVISYIPQHAVGHSQQVPISVQEVVSLGSADKRVIKKALNDVKLAEFSAKRFSELSGGQQQRVLIAQALAAKPSLLILDEPTTGIDERAITEFYNILRQLTRLGITIIMVSHDVDAVLNLVTRVICLNHFILYDGKPEHFELDQYLPQFYKVRHRVLHHHHGAPDV